MGHPPRMSPVQGIQLVLGRFSGPPATHFHYRYPVTFLAKAKGSDATAEAGVNHDEIEVEAGISHERRLSFLTHGTPSPSFHPLPLKAVSGITGVL